MRLLSPDQEPMTSVQVFQMMRVLPTWKEVERELFAAYRPLLQWARDNPHLARRFPAAEALAEARGLLELHDPGQARPTELAERTPTPYHSPPER